MDKFRLLGTAQGIGITLQDVAGLLLTASVFSLPDKPILGVLTKLCSAANEISQEKPPNRSHVLWPDPCQYENFSIVSIHWVDVWYSVQEF